MNDDTTTMPTLTSDTPASDPLAAALAADDGLAQPASLAADAPADDQSQKSPLDILEELLKESGNSGASSQPTAPAAEPGQPTEEEKAKKLEELQEKMAEQAIEDKENIAKQQELLESLKQTPQYQARVQQNEEKAQTEADKDTAGQGFEITQLKHDKV